VNVDPEVQKLLGEMGVNPQDFQLIQQAPTFEDAKRQLEALKDKVKVGFKKLAFELHPDRTDNDPEKTRKFKLACAIKSDVDKLNVSMPQRQAPVPFVQHVNFQQVPIQQVVFVQYYATANAPRPARPPQNAWAAVTMQPNGVHNGRVR
jgi:hypothetical protein